MKAIEMKTDGDGETCAYTHENIVHMFEDRKTDRALGLDPDSRYAIVAHKIPDGYRMATEDRVRPINYMVKFKGRNDFCLGVDVGLATPHDKDAIYAIPIQTAEDKERAERIAHIERLEKELAELKTKV